MKIKEIKNKEVWESFLLECQEKTFLQSWNWGEFQKMMWPSFARQKASYGGSTVASGEGGKIWRWGIYDNDNLISAVFCYKIQARRGTFLLVPHGPNIISNFSRLWRDPVAAGQFPISKQIPNFKYQILNMLLDELKKIAKEEKADFIRIAPIWPARNASYSEAGGDRTEENVKIFKELNFRPAPIHMHPEVTWELDIILPEEELLAGMRKTTRYLIRQAEKNPDIEIIQSQKTEDVEIFNNLHQETVRKHHFVPFSLNYFQKEFAVFQPDQQPIQPIQGCPECTEGQISVFLGKYRGEIVSSAIIVFWQDTAFYHHGASHPRFSKIPASYLLQWRVIQEAKKRGCKLYNFWGISPNEKKTHPWAGLTLFKMGFGGYKKEYVKTQDFPLTRKYWLNFLVEKIRKSKRGF